MVNGLSFAKAHPEFQGIINKLGFDVGGAVPTEGDDYSDPSVDHLESTDPLYIDKETVNMDVKHMNQYK